MTYLSGGLQARPEWVDVSRVPQTIEPLTYDCGYCGVLVGSDRGWRDKVNANMIYVCPHCSRPTYYNRIYRQQVPGPLLGREVRHLPPAVAAAYDEARACASINAHTAVGMLCRKLLMHVAVEQGAKPGKPFTAYIDFLDKSGWISPNGRQWVDWIREHGNRATHEMETASAEDAFRSLTFTEALLRTVYELPGDLPSVDEPAPGE